MSSKENNPKYDIQTLSNLHAPILFYDGECGVCNLAVRFVLLRDRKRRFYFASLQSETARLLLSNWRQQHPDVDSLVVWEEGGKNIYHYSKAIFRICWILGGIWAFPGLLSFLPNWLLFPYSFLYRFLARHRRGIVCFNPYDCKRGALQPGERFLP